jgi:uracil-DNA glycosylase family 4
MPRSAPESSRADPPGASRQWRELHREMLACRRCVVSGHIPGATPMFQGAPGQPIMLVGQAPGIVEMGPRRPFAGRAGAELSRWAMRAGFEDDNHFRALTYVTSVTKCFPGKAVSGSGDRRPSAVEVAQCHPWLDAQLSLQAPRLVLLVGTLAIEEFLPRRRLEELIGRLFTMTGEAVTEGSLPPGRLLLPLPHPSGASRWLNDPGHRVLLDRALDLLARTWPLVAAPEGRG